MNEAATRPHLERLDAVLRNVDWDRIVESLEPLERILRELAAPEVLGALYERVLAKPELIRRSERFNLFSKVLLHRDPATGCKLRLHVFEEPIAEAHNHRASFAALILRGSYTHTLYGGEEASALLSGGEVPHSLFVQRQRAGTCYAIHHAMVHSTLADETTVSLMLQGPPGRDEFHIIDLGSGQVRSRTTSQGPDVPQEAGERGLTAVDLDRLRGQLRAAGVLPEKAPVGEVSARKR
ncbi:hypothetical protein ACFYOD_35270 [Streptomyces sp. NPDC006703]|uniref:hypothetical protein n=1 Tax=Streptomyces sp. NPDC006703 TaxID=3364759 RepID=UPI0036B73775